MTAVIRLLGIGSPWGDDRVGMLAVQAMADIFHPAQVAVSVHDRPGATLISLLRGTRTAVLVDAVRSGARPGTLHRMEGEAVFAAGRNLSSTHGFGLADALALAEELGDGPSRLVLWGVEIEAADFTEKLSPAVRAALPGLVGAVSDEVRRTLNQFFPE
jgi:hydrogenase maturation protease